VGFNLRFALAATLLAGTAVFLKVHPNREVFPPRRPLASLPRQLGIWQGTDMPISGEVLKVLGKGDFLSRGYQSDSASEPIALFVAYFVSQRYGDTIHSPEHCLPGSGWSPIESRQITLSLPGHAPFRANRYLMDKKGDRQLVLYWYWAHDRAEASEYWSRFYLVVDSIRLNRSDGALIRVSTPLRRGETSDDALKRLVTLAGELVPIINSYVPR